MKWRVNQKDYNIFDFSDEQRTAFYEKLYKERPPIICLCNEGNGHLPLLHIRKTSKYFPASNGSNSKKGILHADDCIHNTLYRNFLIQRGLNIKDDGTIVCKIDTRRRRKSKSSTSDVESKSPNRLSHSVGNTHAGSAASLRTLFLALLQKYNVHHFRIGQNRNVYKRIYKAMCESIVDGEPLNKIGYITHSNEDFIYRYKRHKFIIGWGNKNSIYQDEKGFWKIPLYCLDDPKILKMTYSIPNWVYEKATFTNADDKKGYFVIWRKTKSNGELGDNQLIFVPSDETTMIPIESSHEGTMLQYLMKNNIEFKKPLLVPGDEDYRPDFILDTQKPQVVIEVAGLMNNIDYVNHLRQKQAYYLGKGYKYLEWDVRKPLKIDI